MPPTSLLREPKSCPTSYNSPFIPPHFPAHLLTYAHLPAWPSRAAQLVLQSRGHMALTPLCSPTRLVGLALGVSSLATSFTSHRCCTSSAPSTRGLPAVPSHRHRWQALRLASRQEQGEGDTNSRSTAVSEFEQTSGPVKTLVGGLTDLFVLFSGGGEDGEALSADTAVKVRTTVLQMSLSLLCSLMQLLPGHS